MTCKLHTSKQYENTCRIHVLRKIQKKMIIRVEIKLVLFSFFLQRKKVRHPFLLLIRQNFHSFLKILLKILQKIGILTRHLKCLIYQPSDFTFSYSPMTKHTLSKQQQNQKKNPSKAANFPNIKPWDISNLTACCLHPNSKIFKWYIHIYSFLFHSSTLHRTVN